MKTPAFAYLRVSGKGQIDGDGFPRQRDTVNRYAKAHRIEIAAEFRDEGVGGAKDSFDRPGLTDLLVAIKANGVRLVLIERSDRLARDLMIGEIVLAEFRSLGVRVVAADSGTDLTVEDGDPTRTLMRQMLGAIAQWEKSVIVQKLRAARVRMRRDKGRCEGRKPFGETPEERATIDKIMTLKSEKRSDAAIAEELNKAGIPPRAGRKWYPMAIYRIVARQRAK